MTEGVDGVSESEGPTKSQTEAEVLEALQVPTQRIIAIGLGLWLVALLVTLVVPALHTGSRDWWPWACVAGFVLGAIGLLYVRRGRGNAHDAG
ncbi:DUF2530 domain-containing protein [Knoellia pratensis]|uniref:DUF2530 domain-containing protein n=1 Tax=Knoellia pratensis TaxID=3404796 RepID=UPI003614EE16